MVHWWVLVHCGQVEDLEAPAPFFWVAKFGQEVKLKNQKFENKLIFGGLQFISRSEGDKKKR